MRIKKKTLLRKLFFILLLFIYLSQIGLAGEQIVLSPQGGHSNQKQINEAIKQAATSARGVSVFLTAGIYEVDNTIIMRSNVRLLGDPDAIIRVSSTSSQWFTGRTGVISSIGSIKNVEIAGFQIDGNIKNLPTGYANSQPGREHDCEKLINIGGYSGDFANNIKIHDMKLYNAFSDGIYIIYADGVACYDNKISNCQHEGIYFSVVRNGYINNNKIAGITSDCARLDNCDTCLVEYNLFFSYGGESYGAYKHGANGLQIGDASVSKGYDARKTGYPTRNIEVRFNTFADPGLKAIWLHGGENVYIHDNEFVDAAILETMGVPIGDISIDNQPTLEMTEKVFDSIFDILEVEFTDTGRTDQIEEDIHYTIQKTESGRIAGGIKIVGFRDLINIDGVPYIPKNDSVLVKYEAVKAPSYSWNNTGVSQIKKDVDIKNENGNVTATLTVTMEWYKLSTDSTGTTKKKYKTSKAVFSDTVKAPEVLQRPSEIKGILYEYPIHSLAYVPSEGLTKVKYEYDGKEVNHIYLLGEQHRNDNGVIYTNFSKVNYWNGDLDHQGEFLYINGSFDPEKLTVTAYTPYESFQVIHFDHIKKDYPDKFYADWLFPSFGLFLIFGFGAWYYIRKILY
ncbi:MAG: right-handed parallel beta-helix repeat-containing protein [Bacilli bacterium]|nr:right-handed parallel beta-helix repeat-containing protein [Bacilli bacterium]